MYCVRFDIAINDLAGFCVHSYRAGAVDHAVGDNGLGIDAGEGLGGFVGRDGGFGGHFGVIFFFFVQVIDVGVDEVVRPY